MPSSATAVREGNHVKSAPGTGARTGGNSSAHSSLGVSNGTDAAICQEGGSAGSAPPFLAVAAGLEGNVYMNAKWMQGEGHGMAWHGIIQGPERNARGGGGPREGAERSSSGSGREFKMKEGANSLALSRAFGVNCAGETIHALGAFNLAA